MPIFQLTKKLGFPPPHMAEREGLLAVGGDLSTRRLILAYEMGIFPWYSEEDPILWWSPNPRMVLYPDELHVSRSLRRFMNKAPFSITLDTAFEAVIQGCASDRYRHGEGTWLVEDMIDAYCRLHRLGLAHSVEAWDGSDLAGGLYGVSLGRCFFGESMFTRVSNASKIAFVHLVQQLRKWEFDMIDCQVKTDHLGSFGAKEVSRKRFLHELEASLKRPTLRGKWKFDDAEAEEDLKN